MDMNTLLPVSWRRADAAMRESKIQHGQARLGPLVEIRLRKVWMLTNTVFLWYMLTVAVERTFP